MEVEEARAQPEALPDAWILLERSATCARRNKPAQPRPPLVRSLLHGAALGAQSYHLTCVRRTYDQRPKV